MGAWIARCKCGKLTLVYDYLLKSGDTTSCGCEAQRIKRVSGDRPHPGQRQENYGETESTQGKEAAEGV